MEKSEKKIDSEENLSKPWQEIYCSNISNTKNIKKNQNESVSLGLGRSRVFNFFRCDRGNRSCWICFSAAHSDVAYTRKWQRLCKKNHFFIFYFLSNDADYLYQKENYDFIIHYYIFESSNHMHFVFNTLKNIQCMFDI